MRDRDAGMCNSIPGVNSGGTKVNVETGRVIVGNKVHVSSEFIEKLLKKLDEKGTVEEILDTILETASETGMELTKEKLKEAMQAEPDERDSDGAVIAYSSYLIIG